MIFLLALQKSESAYEHTEVLGDLGFDFCRHGNVRGILRVFEFLACQSVVEWVLLKLFKVKPQKKISWY